MLPRRIGEPSRVWPKLPSVARRGLTLVELVVAIALFGLVGALSAQFLVRLLDLTARAGQRSKLQAEAMLSLKHLQADLQQTAGGLVTRADLNEGGIAVGFPRFQQVTGQGARVWDGEYALYRWVPPRLWRRTGGSTDTARPTPLTPGALVGLAVPHPDERLLSDCLTGFGVELADGPSVNLRLQLKIEGHKTETLALSSTVGLRN